MNQHQSQFPSDQSELNYALSDEPILLNGMKVIFDQKASVYPVNLQLKNRKKFNNSLAKSLGKNSHFSGALEHEKWEDFLKLDINQEIYFPLNGNDRLNVLVSDPWKLSQGFDGQCGFVAVIMAMLYLSEQRIKQEQKEKDSKREILQELLNAIYYDNQYREMIVTKRAVVNKGSITAKAKNNIIEVLTINLETETEKFSPVQVEKKYIEVQTEAEQDFIPIKLALNAKAKKQKIPIENAKDFIRIKAIKGVVKNRIEKRLAHYLHKIGEIEYYSPLYVTDYVLYLGLMLFFKDHLKNNLNQDKPKLWGKIMDFNSIFPGFEDQAKDWKDNKPFKKLKDMELGERAYPGYKRGDLGLTREGLEELCLLVGIANISNSNRLLNVKKNMTSFKALDVDREKVISFEYQNSVTNNIDFFLLKFGDSDLKFPCILGVAEGKRILSHQGIIHNLKAEIEKETKAIEEYKSRLKSNLPKKALNKKSKNMLRKKNKQIKEPVQIQAETIITAKKNMIEKYRKQIKNYEKNPEYDKSLRDKEAFSKYEFLEHWVFMLDQNTVWSGGVKFERTKLPEKNSDKHNHVLGLIARGIYWVSVELVEVGI